MLKRIIALLLIATPLMAGDYWVHPSGYFPHTDGVFSRSTGGAPVSYWTDPYITNAVVAFYLQEPTTAMEFESTGVDSSDITLFPNYNPVGGYNPIWWYDKGYYWRDGNAAYMVITNAIADLPSAFSNVTITGWVQINKLSENAGVINLATKAGAYPEFGIDFATSKWRLNINQQNVERAYTFTTAQQVFVALTYDGVTGRFYENGTEVTNWAYASSLATNGLSFNVNVYWDWTYINTMWCRDARLYGSTLSEGQVSNLYNNIDVTNNLLCKVQAEDKMYVHNSTSNRIALYPASYTNQPSRIAVGTNQFSDVQYAHHINAGQKYFVSFGNVYNIYLPNIDNYTNNTIVPRTNDFTVDCWARFKSFQNNDMHFLEVGEQGVANSGGWTLYVEQSSAGTNLGWWVEGNNDAWTNIYSDAGMLTNQWYHCRVIRDYGVEDSMWIDGVKQAHVATESLDIGMVDSSKISMGGLAFGADVDLYGVVIYPFANTNFDRMTYTAPTNNTEERFNYWETIGQ